MPIDTPKESRMSRWSKRKIAISRGEEVEHDDSDVQEIVVDEQAEAEREAELLLNREAAEAVDLETLDKETDFSVFMKEGVPALLKRQAMSALWRSNPVFAVVDGLVDYDDDFGDPSLNMKTFKSAYQIGKGFVDSLEDDTETDVASTDASSVDDDNAEQSSDDDEGTVETPEDDAVEIENDDLEDNPTADNEEVVTAEAEIDGDSQLDIVSAEEPEVMMEVEPKISLRKRLQLDIYG